MLVIADVFTHFFHFSSQKLETTGIAYLWYLRMNNDEKQSITTLERHKEARRNVGNDSSAPWRSSAWINTFAKHCFNVIRVHYSQMKCVWPIIEIMVQCRNFFYFIRKKMLSEKNLKTKDNKRNTFTRYAV